LTNPGDFLLLDEPLRAAKYGLPAVTAPFSGGGFVDANHPAHPLHVLEVIDGFLLGLSVSEFDKSKSPLSARLPVKGEAALGDLSVLPKEIEQVLPFSLKREVANVDGHG